MTTIKFGEKELKIKYSYEATIKSGIIRDLMNMDSIAGDMESVEKLLLFLPEMLLVGLQKFHKEEFGYDPANKDQKEACLEKVYALLDDYFDGEEGDMNTLFSELQKELLENGFLSRMAKAKKQKSPQAVSEVAESKKN